MEGLVRETEGLLSPQQEEWGEGEGNLATVFMVLAS